MYFRPANRQRNKSVMYTSGKSWLGGVMEPYALCQIISAHGCMHGYENQKECVNARILKDPGERNGYPSSLQLDK